MNLKITVLGSGTSSGVPTIGCSCAVCQSADPRDNRLRPSILIEYGGRNIVIDTTPDFRTQVLRAGVQRLDAIVYTHGHADHIMGLDDVRPFNYHQGGRIPIYAARPAFAIIERVFAYVFNNTEHRTAVPQLDVNLIDESPFDVLGLRFEPIPLTHGRDTIFGFRFGNVAYLTDHSDIPAASLDRLRGLDVLFLDALRHKPHPTHSTVSASTQTAQKLQPKRTYFTHICHDLPHAATEAALPPGIFMAYDGLEIVVEQAAAATNDTPGMTVFRSLNEVPAAFGSSVVTIGNFDGIHVGHRRIMRRVVEIARQRGLTASALTFDPHPARVLTPERAPKLIMTVPQRLRSIESEGIDAVLVLPFSLAFAKLSPEEFVKHVLVGTLKARVVVVGEDFRFGNKQAGTVDTLRALGAQFGFEVEAIGEIVRCRERVSSSTVRRLLAEGRVSRACRELGAPFTLEGEVVKGHGIGSKQTVPTLNLASPNDAIPKTGVYVTRTRDVDSGQKWRSITNVGYRPTFDGKELSIETFLLDPLEDAEPHRIEVSFLAFIREERKFENPGTLKTQILRDVGVASRLHRRLEKLGVG